MPEINLTQNFTDVVEVFSNMSYIADLKHRWEEIKKLSSIYRL